MAGDTSSGLEVVCRIAPVVAGNEPCVVPEDEALVRLVPPADYLSRNGEVFAERIYRFAHVFDGSDTQRDVFYTCAFDFIENLLQGQNSLLFTYGVTGSGKTHTMTGNVKEDNSGILPRSLDVLFKSLPNMIEKGVFKPNGQNGFFVQSREDAKKTRDAAPQMGQYEITPRLIETRRARALNNNLCSTVFISYVEVYNDLCYDLFDETLTDARLYTSHAIRQHPMTKAAYVEKINEIEVHTAEEALEQFLRAQERRQVAKTALNKSSSRSHSIFTIRLVTATLEETDFYPLRDSDKINISELSLVDLAGSERAKRTDNTGSRLVEAGKINQSLLVLRQCFDKLRDNAKSRHPTPVPYRDSKLTLLFKNYFDGFGRIRMIICVNPRPTDFEENVHVMNFAELAREIKHNPINMAALPLEDLNSLPFSRRDIIQWEREFQASVAEFMPLKIELFEPPPPIQVLGPDDEDSIQRLREYYLKQEALSRKFQESVFDNTKSLSEAIKERNCFADLQKKEYDKLVAEHDELRQDYAQLSAENSRYKREINALKMRLCRYEVDEDNDRLRDQENRHKIRQKEAELEKKRRTLKKVEAVLNAPIVTTSSNHVSELRKQFDTPVAPSGDNDRKRLRTRNGSKPPVPSKTPITTTTTSIGRNATHMNTRFHRRSQSVGVNGRVLDHQPVNKIPTGTVFQPQIPRNSRHTTRISTDDLKKCTDYIFTNQSRDADGAVRTDLVKGSIIPTAGGGSSVMFNDVEVLRHQKPTD